MKIVGLVTVWSLLLVGFLEQRMAGQVRELQTEVAEMKAMKADEDQVLAAAPSMIAATKSQNEPGAEVPPGIVQKSADPQGPSKRKLGGFRSSATSNAVGVGCMSFSSASTFEVDTDTCADSLRCPPCFISTGGAITVKIVDCDDFYVKTGTALAATQIVEVMFINGGSGSLTIESRQTNAAGTLKSSFVLPIKEHVVGVCYGGSAGVMHFPSNTGLTYASSSTATACTVADSCGTTDTFMKAITGTELVTQS